MAYSVDAHNPYLAIATGNPSLPTVLKNSLHSSSTLGWVMDGSSPSEAPCQHGADCRFCALPARFSDVSRALWRIFSVCSRRQPWKRTEAVGSGQRVVVKENRNLADSPTVLIGPIYSVLNVSHYLLSTLPIYNKIIYHGMPRISTSDFVTRS